MVGRLRRLHGGGLGRHRGSGGRHAGRCRASPDGGRRDSFAQTNLIANKASFHAKLTDKNLKQRLGPRGGADAHLGLRQQLRCSHRVTAAGSRQGAVSLDLRVPVPGGNPTGQVYNPDSNAFPVGGTAGSSALFIVDTDSIGASQSPGEIAAWDGGASFVVEASPTGGPGGKTPAGAVFKGLTLATTPKTGPELFATDVANAKVDVFNRDFRLVKTLPSSGTRRIPAGYAPFNVQELNGKIYVTYGKQNKAKTDVVPGAGLGFVDVYTAGGQLVRHLIARGPLNEPWGLAIAPKGFGPFGGELLVGNLGNGWINVFSPSTGRYLGALDTTRVTRSRSTGCGR